MGDRGTRGVLLPAIAPRRPFRCSATLRSLDSTASSTCNIAKAREPASSLSLRLDDACNQPGHAVGLTHVGGAVQRGVSPLLFGEVRLTTAVGASLRGEVLVDQHDSTLEREQPTQPSVGSSPVASLHGKRELPVSIREHHGADKSRPRSLSAIRRLTAFSSNRCFRGSQQEATLGEGLASVELSYAWTTPSPAARGRR